jgi:hypothetical protein
MEKMLDLPFTPDGMGMSWGIILIAWMATGSSCGEHTPWIINVD